MSSIKRGEKGPPVYLLQGLLNSLGNNLELDGDFGESTEMAVKAFQKKNEALEADGVVGGNTAKAIAQAIKDAKASAARDAAAREERTQKAAILAAASREAAAKEAAAKEAAAKKAANPLSNVAFFNSDDKENA